VTWHAVFPTWAQIIVVTTSTRAQYLEAQNRVLNLDFSIRPC